MKANHIIQHVKLGIQHIKIIFCMLQCTTRTQNFKRNLIYYNASLTIKYLGINLTNIFSIYMAKTTNFWSMEADLNDLNSILYSWMERHTILNMSGLPKWIYKYSRVSIRIPVGVPERKSILTFIWEDNGARKAKLNLKKSEDERYTDWL